MAINFSSSAVTRWVFVLGVGFVGVGCSSAPDVPDAAREVAAERGIPEWVLETPREPGEAFYASGRGEARAIESLALDDARAAARTELARSLQATIQSVFQRYLAEIQPRDADAPDAVDAEVLIQDTTRIVTNLRATGFEIIQSAPSPDGRYWALARVDFDDVVKQLHAISAERFDSVRENSERAFRDLDRILEEQSGRP